MDPSLTGITSQFDPRLAALLGWVVIVVKLLVDWIKTAATLPKWGPPALAFVFAAILIPILAIALGIDMTARLGAQAVILALIAAVLAIGSTALQGRTIPSDPSTLAQEAADEVERRRQKRVEARLREVANDGIRSAAPTGRAEGAGRNG
jgi:hypothetical protein